MNKYKILLKISDLNELITVAMGGSPTLILKTYCSS